MGVDIMAEAVKSPGFHGPLLSLQDVPWAPLGRARASCHDARTPLLDAPLLDAPEDEKSRRRRRDSEISVSLEGVLTWRLQEGDLGGEEGEGGFERFERVCTVDRPHVN